MKAFELPTIEAFLVRCGSRGMSPQTIRAYRGDLTALHDAIGYQDDAESFETAASAWLNKGRKTWAPRTTNRKLASIKSLTKWMGLPGFLSEYLAPTAERLQPHPLPGGVADVKEMLQGTANLRKRALVALCGLCGLRVSEALAVTAADFDRKGGGVWLHVRSGKGDKGRVVPVSEGAWNHLAPCVEAITNGPLANWTDRRARQILTDLGEAALGHHVASHDLRSTTITAVYDVTKSIRIAQEIAGHASSATTEGYIAVRDDDMRNAVELMS
jgi:integrase/recombinase XerC